MSNTPVLSMARKYYARYIMSAWETRWFQEGREWPEHSSPCAVQVVTTYAPLARNLSTISARSVLRHQVGTLRFINVNCPPTTRDLPGFFPRRLSGFSEQR